MTQVPYGDTYATLPDGPAARPFCTNPGLLDRLDRLAAAPNLDNPQAPLDAENTSETEVATSETEEKWGDVLTGSLACGILISSQDRWYKGEKG